MLDIILKLLLEAFTTLSFVAITIDLFINIKEEINCYKRMKDKEK